MSNKYYKDFSSYALDIYEAGGVVAVKPKRAMQSQVLHGMRRLGVPLKEALHKRNMEGKSTVVTWEGYHLYVQVSFDGYVVVAPNVLGSPTLRYIRDITILLNEAFSIYSYDLSQFLYEFGAKNTLLYCHGDYTPTTLQTVARVARRRARAKYFSEKYGGGDSTWCSDITHHLVHAQNVFYKTSYTNPDLQRFVLENNLKSWVKEASKLTSNTEDSV